MQGTPHIKTHPKGECGPESSRLQSIFSMPTHTTQGRKMKTQSFRH